jgi:hypothetical protein
VQMVTRYEKSVYFSLLTHSGNQKRQDFCLQGLTCSWYVHSTWQGSLYKK